jgi:serine/threonine protein kinase/tetratricopeptide (TPR) repeat protein
LRNCRFAQPILRKFKRLSRFVDEKSHVMGPPPEPSTEVALAKGASLGRYVVLGLLGRGGMGEVYAAYDPELDRKIAVKLLRAGGGPSGSTGSDGRTRLLREAQAIARLSHPNVVVVYDVGTFKDSIFIAMEFIEGNTIGYWLAAGDRGWREVLDVYLAAGRGLAAAHDAGLVHRDFKPDNVMLTKAGQVRVMDFGLARVQRDAGAGAEPDDDPIAAAARASALAATLGEELEDRTMKLDGGGGSRPPVGPSSGRMLGIKLTQTGAILGTPAYMAPEQFAGKGGDARSDQFAFCVALYEGLYRGRPFAGTTPTALMASVVSGEVADPPADTRVPTWLRRVLLRGLATNPGQRWPSMSALLAALAQDPAARRRRWAAATVGAVLVAGSAIGAYRFTTGRHTLCAGGPDRARAAWGPTQQESVARAFRASGSKNAASVLASVSARVGEYVARWEAMYRESCEATHVRGEQSAEVLDLRMSCLDERLAGVRALGEVLATADKSVVESARAATSALPALERCADVAMLRAVIKPPDDPATRSEVAALRERAAKLLPLAAAGRCNEAKTVGVPLLARARQVGYQPLEAETAIGLGRLADSCLDPHVAASYLEEAVLAAEASNDDEIAIRASSFFAVLRSDRLVDPAVGGFWVRHAAAILARFPNRPLLEAELASARAVWLGASGRDADALVEQRRSLDLRERAGGGVTLEAADTMLNLVVRLHALGRDEEAVALGERAQSLYAKLAGEDSGQMALLLLDLTEVLTALHRFDRAHAAIERALAIWRESGAEFYLSYGLLYRARLQMAEGHGKEAGADLEQALTGLGDDDAAAEARFELARLLWPRVRDRQRAVALATEARATFAKIPSEARNLKELEAWLGQHRP